MLVQIAWRNLWRNRRRTILTVIAVALSLSVMLAMGAMMEAMGKRMIEALIGSSTGHVQIHREGYREDRQFTLTVTDADSVLSRVRGTEGVVAATGRIYGVAHAAFVRGNDEAVRTGGGEDIASPVVGLFGVQPDHEILVTDLNERVKQGSWLEQETDVVIGQALAKRNGIQVGDAMLPTAVSSTGAMQGPWAVSDQVPRVSGIIHTGVDEIDARIVVMSTQYLSKLIRLEGQVHEIAIRADDHEKLDGLVESIRREVGELRSSQRTDESFEATSPLSIGREDPEGEPPGGDAPTLRLLGVAINEPVEGKEGEESLPSTKLASGHFLQRAEDIVLPQGLAKQLGVTVDDRVTVAVPIDCGDSDLECPPSAESFRVAGIDGSRPDALRDVGLVSMSVVADNIKALSPGLVSALSAEQSAEAARLIGQLRSEAEARDEVMTWSELEPALAQMVTMIETMPLIFLIIVYIAVVFIITNTMLMATFERLREFGVMRALGMRPGRVVGLVVTESFLLSLVGVVFGLAVSIPIIYLWSVYGMDTGFMMEGDSYEISGVVFDPVLWPTFDVMAMIPACIAVIIMTTLAGVYPAIRAALVNPIDALRNEMTPLGRAILALFRSGSPRRRASKKGRR